MEYGMFQLALGVILSWGQLPQIELPKFGQLIGPSVCFGTLAIQEVLTALNSTQAKNLLLLEAEMGRLMYGVEVVLFMQDFNQVRMKQTALMMVLKLLEGIQSLWLKPNPWLSLMVT